MSSSAWPPSVDLPALRAQGGAVRILAAGFETLVEPVEWRDAVAPAPRPQSSIGPITCDSSAELDAMRKDCERRVREAHAAGAREAEAAARTRAAAEGQKSIETLASSVAELAQLRPRLRKQAESDVVQLALAIARRLLRREIAVDPDAIRGLIIAALEKLQAQEIHRVRTTPEYIQPLTAILRQTVSHLKIEVIADSSLRPGGIVFETNQGDLDASIDSQLREIDRGLADCLRRSE